MDKIDERQIGQPVIHANGLHVCWLVTSLTSSILVLYDVVERKEVLELDVTALSCSQFTWTCLTGIGVATVDPDGSENWGLVVIDVPNNSLRLIEKSANSQMKLIGVSAQRPDEILVSTNERANQFYDYETVSLTSLKRSPVFENNDYSAVYFNQHFEARVFETVNSDGERELWSGGVGSQEKLLHISHQDSLSTRFIKIIGSSDCESHDVSNSEIAYVVTTDRAEEVCLSSIDIKAKKRSSVMSLRDCDITKVFFCAETGLPDLVQVERSRKYQYSFSQSASDKLQIARRKLKSEPTVVERSDCDRYWLVKLDSPTRASVYYLFDTLNEQYWSISSNDTANSKVVGKFRTAKIPTRDGHRSVAYVGTNALCSLEESSASANSRGTVLLIHGGPWRRTHWSFDFRRNWFLQQGYNVIEPNYRGSIGFGKKWINLADREWGLAMQDDLEDTIYWGAERGIIDSDRIALVGGSYGGYAALKMACTSNIDVACAIAISPLTDLLSFFTTMPRYWRSALPMLTKRIGDPGNVKDKERLQQQSPINLAQHMSCPSLLIHGINDSRIPSEMTKHMFLKLSQYGKEATFALFLNEGHKIVGRNNLNGFYSLISAFLSLYLEENKSSFSSGQSSMKIFSSPKSTFKVS